MKASLALFPALALAAAVTFAEPPAAKSHANTLSGTVTAVDETQKSLVVRDGRGKETKMIWTGATRMTGGQLKAGATVTVRWVRREGKNIATAVKVGVESEKSAATTPPAPISPTPKSP